MGGASIQKNCVYFVLKYGNNKEGNRKEHDERRTGELERFGIKVLRFTNDQILHDCDLVVEKINAAIKEIASTS